MEVNSQIMVICKIGRKYKGEENVRVRRKDREVTDLDQIFDIVDRCSVAHLGMAAHGKPYVVALNFGYERNKDELILYFHSAKEGRKIEILKENPEVCVQMHCSDALDPGKTGNPCAYGWRYDSVVGEGRVEFLEDLQEKTHALNCLMHHVGNMEEILHFPETMLEQTCVFRLCIEKPVGKHRG